MSILLGDTFSSVLLKEVAQCKNSLTIISPYITTGAVNSLLKQTPNKIHCKFITQPPGMDYLTGAVELDALKRLEKKGFSLFILPKLHTKLYILDERYVYLGSANFTSNGWNQDLNGNVEEMIRIKLTKKELEHINDRYIVPAVEVSEKDRERLQVKARKGSFKAGLMIQLTSIGGSLLPIVTSMTPSYIWKLITESFTFLTYVFRK